MWPFTSRSIRHHITDTNKHARDFLFQRGLLNTSCPGCSANMTLFACSAFKSPDFFIWRCSPCKSWKKIHDDQESSWSCFEVMDKCSQIASICPRTIIRRQLSEDSVGLLGWCPDCQKSLPEYYKYSRVRWLELDVRVSSSAIFKWKIVSRT